MINKLAIQNLLNAEYVQYMSSTSTVFAKYPVVSEGQKDLLDELNAKLKTAEASLVVEQNNGKISEKNAADRRRDNLHSKLFGSLKAILYDDEDPRYADAQAVMAVLKAAGNPTQLPENAQSAMMTALCTSLEPLAAQLENIKLQADVEAMRAANLRFIALEKECRELKSEHKLEAHVTMRTIRRQMNPVYRTIVDVVNRYSGMPSKAGQCDALIAEMNVLVAKYEALLLNLHTGNNGDQTDDGGTPGIENPPPRG